MLIRNVCSWCITQPIPTEGNVLYFVEGQTWAPITAPITCPGGTYNAPLPRVELLPVRCSFSLTLPAQKPGGPKYTPGMLYAKLTLANGQTMQSSPQTFSGRRRLSA